MGFIATVDITTELGDTITDSRLTVLIAAVLDLWDELTRKTWGTATFTEYFSSPSDKVFPDPDRDGWTILLPDNYPITSITSIYDDPDWNYTSSYLVAATDYTHTDSAIYVKDTFNTGVKNIKLTYVAGYADNALPKSIKQIMVRQVAHWFKQAKLNRWDWATQGDSKGGSISFINLNNNLLPEFEVAATRHGRLMI